MTRRRARAARRRQDALGLLLIVLAVLGVGAAGAAGLMLRPPPRDAETLCRLDRPPPAHTLVLIDGSESLSKRHKALIAAEVEAARERLGPEGRLSLFAMSPVDGREPRLMFSKCDPGDGADANPLFQNPADIAARWRVDYRDPLHDAIGQAGKRARPIGSPLVDSITALARDPAFGPRQDRRSLVILSDMMEFLPGAYSLYAAGADYASYRKARPNLGPAPDLSRVSVRLVQLDDPEREARQYEARGLFWAPFFAETGAAEVTWAP